MPTMRVKVSIIIFKNFRRSYWPKTNSEKYVKSPYIKIAHRDFRNYFLTTGRKIWRLDRNKVWRLGNRKLNVLRIYHNRESRKTFQKFKVLRAVQTFRKFVSISRTYKRVESFFNDA